MRYTKFIAVGALAIAVPSMAVAYTITSQVDAKDIHGTPITTYNIKCNNGAVTTAKKYLGSLGYVYSYSGSAAQYPTLDKAAKTACAE